MVFPFVVAVATSTKNSQDIFNYPPTLIPRENQTVEAAEVGLDGDPIPLYAFPDTDASFALVDNNVSVAEFTPLDDPERIIRFEVGTGVETGETVVIDGEEEKVFLIEVDGVTIEAYRSRLTSGGQFVNVDDQADSRVELVNVVEPKTQFGPRLENFKEVVVDKDLGRSLHQHGARHDHGRDRSDPDIDPRRVHVRPDRLQGPRQAVPAVPRIGDGAVRGVDHPAASS